MKFTIQLLFFLTALFSKPYIIGISGASGSGKTTLTNEIRDLAPKKVAIIRQDSYYKDLSHLSPEKRKLQNFDIPGAIDFKELEKNLALLKRNKTISEPIYDFAINSRTGESKDLESRSLIILEGTLIFTSKKIRDLLDLLVFVDTPLDLCLCRRISRDISERQINLQETQAQYQNQVRPMYFKHILPCKEYADLVVLNHQNDLKNKKKVAKTLIAKLT